jgi:FkbM family methyltransferase
MSALASCLCVTEDRPAFAEWLLWNFDKQDYTARELVVVDSSDGPSVYDGLPNVQVVRAPPGTSVPAKRNIALAAAQGEIVTWFDDDDWQHPSKLSLLADALERRQVAGTRRSWFVDLRTGAVAPFALNQGLLFNSAGCRRNLLEGVLFDERRTRASDTPWMLAVRRRARGSEALLDTPLFFWLSHSRNLSNPSGRRGLTRPLDDVRHAIGKDAWAGTDEQLALLRARTASRTRPRARPRAQPTPICVAITTCDRPELLGRLLDDLEREMPPEGIDVRVYDDASARSYANIEARLRARGWSYLRASRRHGKQEWWRWWNTILADLRSTNASTFVVLQDDMRLCRDFVSRSRALWSSITDPRKASLFLHLDECTTPVGGTRWTPVRTRQVGAVFESGWVDCTAFLCERRTLDALAWKVDPISPARWRPNPLLGSGVGAQLSARLHRRRLTMYRANESLTLHADGVSQMNPDARRRQPMRTVRFVDGPREARALAQLREPVTAMLASVPGREGALAAVVEALLPQVDALHVYLNGYEASPPFLADPRLVVAQSAEHGDRGDAGKFFWVGQLEGYQVLCDDDIDYPADYVAQLIAGIERHDRQAVVGFHGATVHERVATYYRSRTLFHFSQQLDADTPVHVLGTGVAGYHSSAIEITAGNFHSPNMADIWFAIAGQQQRVPFVCLAHREAWLREQPGCRADSIYVHGARAGPAAEPTRTVQAHAPWRLHTRPRAAPRGLVRVPVAGPTRTATLLLPERDHITLAVQRSGTYYERDLLDAISGRAQRGTFVDVGAHYGNHTVFFALECQAERVIAVEPNPPAFEGLLENVAANEIGEIAEPLPLAVHPTLTNVEVVALPWRPRRGSPATGNSGTVGVQEAVAGGVRAAPLDELLEHVGPIAVLKVDAEGLSAEILASGLRTLERDRPLVAVETATDDAYARVRSLLAPLGYAPVGRYCWTPTWLWVAG